MVYRFGKFELLPDAEELRKSGALVHLQPQPWRVLLLLVSRAGTIVTREEIREAVWSAETFVDYEQGVNTAIRLIRRALNDNATTSRILQTIPRRGYRFIAPVERIEPDQLLASFQAMVLPPRRSFKGSAVLLGLLGAVVIGTAALIRRHRHREG